MGNGSVMMVPDAEDVVPPNGVNPDGAAPTDSTSSPVVRVRLPKKPGQALVDWLLARKELAQARAVAAQLSVQQREYVRRAKLALEVGEVAFAPGNAVRSGSTAPLATNLFRQAVYWALLAKSAKVAPISPEQLWLETDRAVLQPVAGNDGEYAYLTVVMRSSR